jgi:hypothetical protein
MILLPAYFKGSWGQNQYGQILAPAISALPTSLWVTEKGELWIISSLNAYGVV